MIGLQDKFADLGVHLELELVDRADDIRCALLALVAGCTCFTVGPPGIAKSLLARRVAARISDVDFFDVVLDKMATPEVLFGPWSLAALQAGRWERETTATLATAHIAHIDEVFAAGAALLQGLHWALNERQYRHGTTVIDLPLTTVFCSSNAVPTEPTLAAFWDRLLIRREVSGELDETDFVTMLGLELPDRPAPVLSWAQVRQAQVEAAAVEVSERVRSSMFAIHKELGRVGIVPSPRRMRAAVGVVRASAWLDGRAEAEATDLMVLSDILWIHRDQIVTVRQLVERELQHAVSPAVLLDREIRKVRAQIVDGLPTEERMGLAEELGTKLASAERELAVLERASSSAATARCRRTLNATKQDVLSRLFGTDAEAVS